MKIWDKMRKTSRRITAMHRMKRRWRKKISSRMRKDEISWNKETGTISHVQQTNKQTLQLILLSFWYCMYRALKRIINLCNQLKMFFWVFPRRQFVVGRRFGTLYRFHLQRQVVDCGVWEEARCNIYPARVAD